jgi:hypothetical protein
MSCVRALLVVFATILLWAPPAHACKCAEPASVSDAKDSAAAVFEGRVTKLTPIGSNDLVVELNVVRTWKDADVEHILLRTRQDTEACGFPFAVDQSYLVYANEAASGATMPGLEVLQCGRTQQIERAEADMAVLGMGVVPVSARKNDLPPGAEASEGTATAEPPSISAQRSKPAAGGCASCSSVGARPARGELAYLMIGVACVYVRLRRCRSTSTSTPFKNRAL